MAHNCSTGKRSFAQIVESSSGDDVPLPRPRYPAPKRRRVVASPDDEYIPDSSTGDDFPDADDISFSVESDFSEDDNSDIDSVASEATAVATVYSRNATVSPEPQADDDDSDSESSSSEEEELVLVLPEIPDPEEELDSEELEYLAAYLVRQGHATAEDALESAQNLVEESLEFEQGVMEERRRIMEARADRIMEDVEYGDYGSGSSADGSSASGEEEGGCRDCDWDSGYDDSEDDDGGPAYVEQEAEVEEDSDEWVPGEDVDEDSDEYFDVEDNSDEEFERD